MGRGCRSPSLMSREMKVPYHVTYPMMHLMLPTPRQIDACENITFPQPRLWVVINSAIHKAVGLMVPGHSMALPGTTPENLLSRECGRRLERL